MAGTTGVCIVKGQTGRDPCPRDFSSVLSLLHSALTPQTVQPFTLLLWRERIPRALFVFILLVINLKFVSREHISKTQHPQYFLVFCIFCVMSV